MVRPLFQRSAGHISTGLFYQVWTRSSVAAAFLWLGALVADDSWIAQTGLAVILILLLVSGLVLLFLGIRDLSRDIRHFLHVRSEKNGHDSLGPS